MRLNDLGRIVTDEWHRTPDIRREIALDAFVVMPNHIHGVLHIRDVGSPIVGADGRPPLQRMPRSLGSFVAGFKSITTKRINVLRDTPRLDVWQRNYYERIIRDDDELNRVREYIKNNPKKWSLDSENPNQNIG